MIALNGQRLPGLLMVEYANASNSQTTLDANDRWTLYGTANNFPSSAYITAEESEILSKNSTAYTDYLNTMAPKFITGAEELTEASFAAFVQHMNELGVEEATQIRQDIYDRHISH